MAAEARLCGLPKVSQLVSSAIRAGTGFPMHVLSTTGEVSFFQFLLLEKLSKVKVARSRSEGAVKQNWQCQPTDYKILEGESSAPHLPPAGPV